MGPFPRCFYLPMALSFKKKPKNNFIYIYIYIYIFIQKSYYLNFY